MKIITEDGRTWEILHWQYLAWGDHGKKISYLKKKEFVFLGLPGSPLVSNQRDNVQLAVLLEFFEKIGCSNVVGADINTSPMIVHCSAGIGRSGATIAIDMILNRIRTEGYDTEIEIPGLITHIRSQRSGKFFLMQKN